LLSQGEFEKTFVRFEGMSTLKEYIVKVTEWKERLENLLDKRPRYKSLETWSHWLIEYQLNKLEEVVMPGSWAEVSFCVGYSEPLLTTLTAQGQQGPDGQYPPLLFEG
jgi:hypothetical protein